MSDKKKINTPLWVAIIGAAAVILAAVITGIFQSGSGSEATKIQIDKNEGGVKYAERDINEYHVHKDSIPPPATPTYKLIGSSNNDLIKRLEADNKLDVTASGDHTIEVTFSGELKPLANSSTVFYYQGGHVIIKVDGDECAAFSDLLLPSLQAGGKDRLTATLKSEVNKHVEGSTKTIAAAIRKCLE